MIEFIVDNTGWFMVGLASFVTLVLAIATALADRYFEEKYLEKDDPPHRSIKDIQVWRDK